MGKDKLNSILRLVVEIEKSIIIVNELSDEYIDKKKQIEEAYSEIIIQYIDAIKIAKSICGLF